MSWKLKLTALLILCGLTIANVSAKESWSDQKSNITVGEYLNLFFQSELQNFRTADKLEIYFVANQSPQEAILYLVKPVVIPISDLPTRADQTNALKQKAKMYEAAVSRLFKNPSIQKRWPGSSTNKNMIVHFVASHDRANTIGLYSQGKEIFKTKKLDDEINYVRKSVGRYFQK